MDKKLIVLSAFCLFLMGVILSLSFSPQYGATSTHTIGGDLTVVGNTTYTGTATNTGLITANGGITVTGATTINQKTGQGNVLTQSQMDLVNATTTPCALQNTTGSPLAIVEPHFWETSSTNNGGTFTVVMGTSTGAFSQSTSPFFNTTITRGSTNTVNVTTSTVLGGGLMWEAGDWITGTTGTTTNSGECAVSVM